MAGATGDALEWALALLQAPGQRHALRGQPLPVGMERLLAIAAGGDPAALAGAARAFGEPEARLQEAARFYIRQVLFHPEADAYRVLGARPDADADTLKTHHRLLQRWLHPDRISSRDDAVFATRVNQAWQQLRGPDRRRAYDASLRRAPPPAPRDSQDRMPALPAMAAWTAPAVAEPPPLDDWRRRAPVLALVLACAVLAIMALRDGGPVVDPWDARASAPAPPAPGQQVLRQALEAAAAPADAPASRGQRDGRRAVASVVAPRRARAPDGAGRAPAPPPVLARAPIPVPVAVSQVAPAAPVAPTAARPAPAPADAPVEALDPPALAPVETAGALPDFDRIRAAEAAGTRLLHYLQAHRAPSPPIWTSPALEARARAVRAALQRAPAARIGPPQWRIGTRQADVRAAVTRADGGSDQVVAELTWREAQWLVTDLRLEPLS